MVIEKEQSIRLILPVLDVHLGKTCGSGHYQGNDKWSWGDDIVKFSTIHCAEFFAWRWYGYDVD